MWRLLYAIPSYILFLIMLTVLVILGWILVPIAAACKAYESFDHVDGAGNYRLDWRFTWKFMWLWDNREDGIAGGLGYMEKDKFWSRFTKSMFARIIYWSANRNPVNNLRNVSWLNVKIDPKKVNWIGSLGSRKELDNILDADIIRKYDTDSETFWCFTWQGFHSVIRFHFKLFGGIQRFWLGWKIHPDDALVEQVGGYRKDGAGFAAQFKRVWPKK